MENPWDDIGELQPEMENPINIVKDLFTPIYEKTNEKVIYKLDRVNFFPEEVRYKRNPDIEKSLEVMIGTPEMLYNPVQEESHPDFGYDPNKTQAKEYFRYRLLLSPVKNENIEFELFKFKFPLLSIYPVQFFIDKKNFGAEFTLSEALTPLDNQFDFILIDTSPGWDQLIVNVLFYSTEVLVPVALEVMPLHGMSEFMKSLGAIQKYRSEVQLKYIVPTFLDLRIKGPKVLYDQLKKLYPQQLCSPIRYNESLAEAPSFGKTIFEYRAKAVGAKGYRNLIKKVTTNN